MIRDELEELVRKYGNDRKTRIQSDANRELTPRTWSPPRTWSSRSPSAATSSASRSAFRSQRRGGKGKLAMITREEDAVRHLMVANTHDNILFFTNRGRVFITKVHTLPEASRQAKGLPIINLPGVMVDQGEYVSAIITIPQFEPDHDMAGHSGRMSETSLPNRKIRSNGLIAISWSRATTALVGLTDGQSDIILATRNGQAARFTRRGAADGRDTRGVPASGCAARRGDRMEVVAPGAEPWS